MRKKITNNQYAIIKHLSFGYWVVGIDDSDSRRGFTLIETLVAISILLLAVAAPLTLGSQGLTTSRIARDQVIGTYLIQEGIEYIRNVRDTNRLSGQSWLSNLDMCTSGTCQIDVPANDVTDCSRGCAPISFNNTTGLYGYTTGKRWETTKFTREISVEETVGDAEARIVVSITWKDGLITRTISADEYVFNWE
jgi:prepilin-type N-terminal cleavage/methylation domain-containing protein